MGYRGCEGTDPTWLYDAFDELEPVKPEQGETIPQGHLAWVCMRRSAYPTRRELNDSLVADASQVPTPVLGFSNGFNGLGCTLHDAGGRFV